MGGERERETKERPQYELRKRRTEKKLSKRENSMEGGDGVKCECGGRISGAGNDKDKVEYKV